MTTEPFKILVISNFPLLAHLTGRALESFTSKPEVIMATINDSQEFEIAEIIACQPDIILVFYGLQAQGLELGQIYEDLLCKTATLLICSQYFVPPLEELVEFGVKGIVVTTANLEELETAIHEIVVGQPETLHKQYLRVIQKLNYYPLNESLSPREKEILQLLAEDLTNKEIASRLSLQPKTIEKHLERVYRKLGVSGKTAAVVKALRKGIITFPY